MKQLGRNRFSNLFTDVCLKCERDERESCALKSETCVKFGNRVDDLVHRRCRDCTLQAQIEPTL